MCIRDSSEDLAERKRALDAHDAERAALVAAVSAAQSNVTALELAAAGKPRRLLTAYFLWLFCPAYPWYALYLGRDLHAWLYTVSFGGFGTLWLVDGLCIPWYVYDWNAGALEVIGDAHLDTLVAKYLDVLFFDGMDVGEGSNEDDLTIKLQEIIDVNSALRQAIRKGGSMKMIVEGWNFLQVQGALYLNGEVPGLQPRNAPAAKPIRGLCQRLKGKSGRFRGNLSGKRVDFSARTVISPDPNLRVDQVGVPQEVAKIMTYPEQVNAQTLEKLQKLVVAGQKQWPGANYVEIANHDDPGAGDRPPFKKSLLYGDRARIAKELRVGDVVERHMQDGDVVLFNRQPSLHKLSIMSHEVKVMPWRTFRFNECVSVWKPTTGLGGPDQT